MMGRVTPPPVKSRKRYMVKTVQDIVNTRFARHARRIAPSTSTAGATDRPPVDLRLRNDGKIKCLSRDGAPERTEVLGAEKRTCWHGMKLDAMRIKVHDAVFVKLSNGREGQALVTSLFEVETPDGQREFKAHVHWLASGPVGGRGELFLRHCQCDDIPLRSIRAKVSGFRLLRPADATTSPEHFARLVWHETECIWRQPVPTAACDSCHHRGGLAAHRPEAAKWYDAHFTSRGVVFHVGEHVLVDSRDTGVPWEVGIILGLQNGAVELRMLLRRHDLQPDLESSAFRDERELFLSHRHIAVPVEHIVRKTFVSNCATEDSEFFCRRDAKLRPLAGTLPSCAPCRTAATMRQADILQLLEMDKLPAVDLYSGGGGTIQGAKPFFKVTTAVEIDPTACKTLSINHAGTEVLRERVAVLHHRALRHERDGFEVQGRVLPPKGSIFMLSAGSPCQGHSGANRHKDGEDLRNEELAHTISELSRVQADVFLLENVRGFTQERSDGAFTDDAESSSFADMAVKMLLAIGHQCRVALLDSRAYGSPQRRVRCFVLAARSGVPLPDFPEPTHASPRPAGMRVHHGDKEATMYSCPRGVTPGTGLYPPITALDATSDLPGFDFALANTQASTSRRPSFPALVGPEGKATRVGFIQPTRYATPPQNSFQLRMRGDAVRIRDHYTGYLTPKQLDLVLGASTYVGDKDSSAPGSERKLRPDSGFYTLLTNPMPGGRTTGTIHWDQKRTFSIAERRRAMGFPDTYVFAGTPPQIDHQLGNAMVVNLMECIYRQIMIDTVLPWWTASGRPRDLMRAWRRDHPVQ